MNNELAHGQEYPYMETLKAHLTHLLETRTKRPLIAAIDGRCASGKTTAANLLQEQYGWTVVHADDFFLRPEQRTPERYAEPGGNLDRERLKEEVLMPLREGKPVNYRRFDCSKMELGETVSVPLTDLVIVEGSYSLHPELRRNGYTNMIGSAPRNSCAVLKRAAAGKNCRHSLTGGSRWKRSISRGAPYRKPRIFILILRCTNEFEIY